MPDKELEGLGELPELDPELAAQADKATRDKYTNVPADTSNPFDKTGRASAPEDLGKANELLGIKGGEKPSLTNFNTGGEKPTLGRPTTPPPGTEDGDGPVPTSKYLTEKKKWKEENEAIKGEVAKYSERLNKMEGYMNAMSNQFQPGGHAPPVTPPPPSEEPFPEFEPILDADGQPDPRFAAMQKTQLKREQALVRKVATIMESELGGVKSASAKQAVHGMIEGHLREEGIDPTTEEAQIHAEILTAFISGLPVQAKERAPVIVKDRLRKLRKINLDKTVAAQRRVKKQSEEKNAAEVPPGGSPGRIPKEILESNVPNWKKAELFFKHQEELG